MTGQRRGLRGLLRDTRASEAIELAFVAFPFLYVLLMTLQVGLYYMTQSALDAAINTTANNLRNTFNTSATAVLPTGTALKASVASNSGGLIANNATLAVDLRALTTLGTASVAISDGTVDAITTSVPIVLRAQSSVVTIAPGFGSLTKVQSAAILRFDAF